MQFKYEKRLVTPFPMGQEDGIWKGRQEGFISRIKIHPTGSDITTG